ncbi:hypothetical protein ASE48_16205 [Mycobacterium sp. Root265]|uniref:helix-turn-helix domain-containing protein n=1 Tax=Mycobacterium sp. Root265 TaxID=1736504 RepID=UPI00070E0C30|nr:helix-turn-helix domain-containing protein [Mycobacterium sp. Root265]KRD05716.1 hypothetical protein ASE48_16205 [Mycobacterium sp. Root265]
MTDLFRLNSIKDVIARTRLSRSTIYLEIERGHLRSVKVGSRRLITEAALIDYISSLDDGSADAA